MILGFILAGGKSSRMGEDKAFLRLEGRRLIEIALANVAAAADEVRIVGARDKFDGMGLAVIEDVYRAAGPLGGIHAALQSTTAEWNLITGVDTPFLDPAFLRYLVQEAQRSGAVVTSPRVQGSFEPLCSVYRPPFVSLAESALRAGDRRIAPLFALAPQRTVEESEIAGFERGAAMFDNLNTPADFGRAHALRAR